MRSWILRFSAVIILAASLLSAGMATAEDPLSKKEFLDYYVAELARAAPQMKVEVVSDLELKITGPDGGEKTQYLDNAYREYRANPEALDETVARFVRVATALVEDEGSSLTASNAIVLVRSMEFVESHEALLAERGETLQKGGLAYRPLPGGLIAVIAADRPDVYSYSMQQDVIDRLGPLDGAWKIALANTPGLIGKPEGEEVGGLVLITTPGGSASSLLVVDDFWATLEKTGLGVPVVLVTSRDSLLIGFEGRRDSLRDLKLIGRKMVEEPGEFDEPMLSSALLAWRKGKWELYEEYPY
jgi:hypothetical protein